MGIEDVRELTSVEMIRDGGSLAACYTSRDDERFWLFFKVERMSVKHEESTRPGWETGESVRTGYQEPVIRHRPDKGEAEISWQEALTFLQELGSLLPGARVSSREWWEAMVRVAEAEGAALPDDPVLGHNYALEYFRRIRD